MDNVTELYPQNADNVAVTEAIFAAIEAAIAGMGKPVSGVSVIGALRLYEYRLLRMTHD